MHTWFPGKALLCVMNSNHIFLAYNLETSRNVLDIFNGCASHIVDMVKECNQCFFMG
jgi:hypothetical protein